MLKMFYMDIQQNIEQLVAGMSFLETFITTDFEHSSKELLFLLKLTDFLLPLCSDRRSSRDFEHH